MTVRVYFDQNVWIKLAEARIAGGEYEDVYLFAREAARQGGVSFVLSHTHLYETQKRPKWKSRLDVVETMVELSGFHTISHQTPVVQYEVDRLFSKYSGLPQPGYRMFGVSLRHLMGDRIGPAVQLRHGASWQDLDIDSRLASIMDKHPGHGWDTMLLAGMNSSYESPDLERYRETFSTLAEFDKKFSTTQEIISQDIDQRGPRAQLEMLIAVYVLSEIWPVMHAAAERHGVSTEQLIELCGTYPKQLVKALPSRHIVQCMLYMRQLQRQKKWVPSDLQDITALSVAVAYCDVVVTEKGWVDNLTRCGAHAEHRTALLSISDLAALPGLLLRLERS